MEPITAADVQTAYAAVLRVDLNSTVAAAIADSINNGNQTFDEYVAGLIQTASNSTVPTIAVLSFFEGLVPSEARVDSVSAFSQSQFAAYAAKGVGNPALGPYEAIGYALASDPANGFDAKYGTGVFATSAEFISAVYVQVFGQLPSGGALTSLLSQLEGAKSLTQMYLNDNISADQAVLLARGAVLGQIIGYAFQPDPDNLAPDSPLVGQVTDFLENAATGDTTDFGVALPAPQPVDGQIFTLTAGTDTIQGQPGNLIGSKGTVDNSGNDTILAGDSSVGPDVVNNLGSGDLIDGGAGTDVLKIISQSNNTLVPTLSNVERIEIQGLAATNINLINNTVGSVGEIINARSTANVNVTNVQAEAIVGAVDTNSRIEVTFAPDVTFGGDIALTVNGAGVVGDTGQIRINTADAANLTTLNIESKGVASFLDIDIDDAPGAGVTAKLLTLNISGDADLVLREENNQGETDFLTTVAVTSTAKVDLDLESNDQNVTVTAADGGLTLVIGDGTNTITTGAGVDNVTVGTGVNTVSLGAGDDFLDFGATGTKADSADGGDGIDTIKISVDDGSPSGLEALTANGDFAAKITSFEKVYAGGDLDSGDVRTVNLANLDNINYIITDGTDATSNPAVGEVQQLKFAPADASGGSIFVTVHGNPEFKVDIPVNATDASIAVLVRDAIIAKAYPEVTDVVINPGDAVRVTFASSLDNLPAGQLTVRDNTALYGAGYIGGTDGVAGAVETFTVTVANGSGPVVADATYTLNEMTTAGAAKVYTFAENADRDTIGNAIASQTNGDSSLRYTAVYNSGTKQLTFTAKVAGNPTSVTEATDPGNSFAAPVVTDGAASTKEVQNYSIPGNGSTDAGRLTIAGVLVDIPASATPDDIGAAIGNKAGLILAADTRLESIAYNTLTNILTVTFKELTGNIDTFNNGAGATAGLAYNGDNDAGNVVESNTTITNGFIGEPAGTLTLNNVLTGGTLELRDDNSGITNINLGTQTAADSFSILLKANIGNNNGKVNVAGIETLNVAQENATTTTLGLGAADTKTVVVTGVGGVNFIDAFAKLTSFDATGVTGTGVDGAVVVTTNATTATTLTGGTGNDVLTGSNTAIDTINGGVGADVIIGRGGADVLTGGAGADTFTYLAVGDSQGSKVDTITDFTTGSDKIDLSAIAVGGGTYDGEAANLGQVLTGLSGAADGTTRALFDTSTSTLYVDINGDGVLNDFDMAIQLTGVTTLAANGTDFTGFIA